jgi:acetoacetyl-CoA reductase
MAKRLALVTGGMGGLGETISTKMADAGYRVAVTYSPSNKGADQWRGAMKDRGYDFHVFACDVADFESCKACIEAVTADLGPVDILVNNAGITRDMTFRKMSKGDWDAVLRTNLDSVFNVSKQVCDGMVDRGWGRIINVSSVNGSKGAFGQTNYSAAKAGMHGYIGTKMVTAIPKEILDSKIIPQIPLGRLGRPEEVAGLIIYLCSEEAAFVNGANIAINGGQHMA